MNELDDLLERLAETQRTCFEDAMENAEMGHREDQRQKSGRGDRFWHYKNANECLTLAIRIQRFLDIKAGEDKSPSEADRKLVEKLMQTANDQVKKYRERKGA